MPKLQVNDLEIFYEKKGKGDPLLLINGFTNHLGMWDKMDLDLAKNFEVILFDHRGSGRTTVTPPPYTIETIANDTIALMDALSIPSASMVGFSMGGAVIQSIGLNHSKRINKGVLLASFSTLPKTAMMQANNISKLFQAGVDPALALESILPWIYSNQYLSSPQRIEKAIQESLENPFPQDPQGYVGQLEAVLNFDSTDTLNQISTEMLIVHGDCDLYTPLYSAEVLKENLQNATLEIIPDMGHMLPYEQPKEMVKLINAFCKS